MNKITLSLKCDCGNKVDDAKVITYGTRNFDIFLNKIDGKVTGLSFVCCKCESKLKLN